MNQLRTLCAAVSAVILMSGCIAYPVGNRDNDRDGYSREGERTDCRDRRNCAGRDSERRDRDSDRRNDRDARP